MDATNLSGMHSGDHAVGVCRTSRVYVDIRDRDNDAMIDAKTLTVSAHYDLAGKGGRCSGLAIDVKTQILFAGCREPQMMVMLSAVDGKILDALPIGAGVDSAIFNPVTMETYRCTRRHRPEPLQAEVRWCRIRFQFSWSPNKILRGRCSNFRHAAS